MTKVSPKSVGVLPKIVVTDHELTTFEVSPLARFNLQKDTDTSQSANEVISTHMFCQYDHEAAKTIDSCMHITCKYKLQMAKEADSSKKHLEIIANNQAFHSTSSLESEKVIHEEIEQKRIERYKSILCNTMNDFSWQKLFKNTFGIILFGVLSTLPMSLIPAHDLVQFPEYWYEILFHGSLTAISGYCLNCCFSGYFMNLRYTFKISNVLIICLIGIGLCLFALVLSYVCWTKVFAYQYPIPFLGLALTCILTYPFCIMIWYNFPREWRQNKEFKKRMKYCISYWSLQYSIVIIYRLIAYVLRNFQQQSQYQPLISLLLILTREVSMWLGNKLLEKTSAGDIVRAITILKYQIFVSHAIVLCTVVGSYISNATSWVLIGSDFCLNILVCIRLINARRKTPQRIHHQIKLLQDLTICELVEFQTPLSFMIVYVVTYYGPNSCLFGNISNDYWAYEAIDNIGKDLENMMNLFLVDFLSIIISAIALWYTCKIDIFKSLRELQKEFWPGFCVIIGSNLIVVCFEVYLLNNCKLRLFTCKQHSFNY